MHSCLLYVGTRTGFIVLEYTPNHQALKQIGRGLEEYAIRGIAVHPDNPHTAYIGCALPGYGLYRTQDAGQSFEHIGFHDKWVWDVSYHPGQATTIYVGTEPPMLYRSVDAGQTFHDFPALEAVPSRSRWRFFCEPFYAGHVHGVGVHPDHPQRLFAGIEHGALIYSHDDGQTWHDALIGYDVHRLIVDPANADHIFAAAGEGLFVSHDAGQTWTAVPNLDHAYVTNVLFDPQTPGCAYANVARAKTPIYKTEDGGQTWVPIGSDLPMVTSVSRAAYGISLHPRQPHTLFYGSDISANSSRLFVSHDAGANWQALDADLPKMWLISAG